MCGMARLAGVAIMAIAVIVAAVAADQEYAKHVDAIITHAKQVARFHNSGDLDKQKGAEAKIDEAFAAAVALAGGTTLRRPVWLM